MSRTRGRLVRGAEADWLEEGGEELRLTRSPDGILGMPSGRTSLKSRSLIRRKRVGGGGGVWLVGRLSIRWWSKSELKSSGSARI